MVKITTKSGQVYEVNDNFATIQRAMQNKTLIEINTSDKKMMLSPDSIESIEADKVETNSVYKLNAAKSNFPFQMTEAQMLEQQAKLQPLKALFDAKKEAMLEMKRKEDETLNAAYQAMYAPHQKAIEDEKARVAALDTISDNKSIVEATGEENKPSGETFEPQSVPVKSAGRPRKQKS